jgi:hypothetical protein
MSAEAPVVPPESTTDIDVEGSDFASLLAGFSAIGMEPSRQATARALVEEIAMRNAVTGFRWYKPSGSNELSCYWDGTGVNVLWIATGHVHMRADGPALRPERPADWSGMSGQLVGWTLPGFIPGDSGTGGSIPRVSKVPCPDHLAPPQPPGAECPVCGVEHELDPAS